MTKTLKQRAVRSGSWVVLGHVFSQGLRLGSNLVLTRLLVPEMFGVMAIVTVIMSGLAMFSDVGLLQNIVQSKRGEEPDYLHTAWTIQVIRGFIIFLIAITVSAGLYYLGKTGCLSSETVYGNTELPLILAVVSITSIISGFNSINILLLNRQLMLGKLIVIELVSQVMGIVFMLSWAWYQRDIWALVYGGIVSASVKMILSNSLNLGERCRFCWDKAAVHEVFHFGKWIFLSSILGFMLNQGDRVILGGLVSPEELGIYTIAFFLANALKDVISKLLISVFFPFLSDVIRNEPEKIESVYYKIRFKIDIITLFVAGLLFSIGSDIIDLLYDSRYENAGWMLEILSITIASIGFMLADQLLLSYGKPKYASLMILVQVISLYIFVPLCFFYYGLLGAVWAIAINPIIKILFTMLIMKINYFINFKRELMLLPLVAIGYLTGEQFKHFMILNIINY